MIISILSYLTTFLFGLKVSFFEIEIGNLYYLCIICILSMLLLNSTEFNLNKSIFSFYGIAFISILLNDIPSFFRPYERFISFLIVTLLIGPAINNNLFSRFKMTLWFMINFLIVFLVTISFFGIILGLTKMNGRGGVTGVFNHSMVLGPMAAISFLNSVYFYESEKTKNRIFYLLIAIISFIVCIAAGSRGALISSIVGLVVFYFLKSGRNFYRVLKVFAIMITIAIISFPLWKPYTERIVGKMEYSQEQGELLVTRSALWNMRIEEFLKSPIFGVGFSAVDIRISDRFDKITGVIEPGSSWLIILSMTGLFGAIVLFFLIIKYCVFLIQNTNNDLQLSLNAGLLFFFMVHFFFEGYLFASGSGLFFYFWLLLGIISIQKRRVNQNSIGKSLNLNL